MFTYLRSRQINIQSLGEIKRREVSWTLTKKLSQLAEESKEVELG